MFEGQPFDTNTQDNVNTETTAYDNCLPQESDVPILPEAFSSLSGNYLTKDSDPYRQDSHGRDEYSAEWDPLVTNNSSERQSSILDSQSFNVNTDHQTFLEIPTTVSDTHVKEGVENEFSDENYLLEKPDVPLSEVISDEVFKVLGQNTALEEISTKATEYDKNLPEEPDAPPSEAIFDNLKVLGLDAIADYISSNSQSSNVNTDLQPFLKMRTTVSDMSVEEVVDNGFSDDFSYHQQLELLRKQNTVQENYILAKEPETPLFKVISEAFQVLGLTTTTEVISTDSTAYDEKSRMFLCLKLYLKILKFLDWISLQITHHQVSVCIPLVTNKFNNLEAHFIAGSMIFHLTDKMGRIILYVYVHFYGNKNN